MMLKTIAISLVAVALLAGCSSSGGDTQGQPVPASSFSQFPDLPTPDGATMDADNSFLVGQGDQWLGRLVVRKRFFSEPAQLYDFYHQQMPNFGWQEVASVRGSASVQTWQRGARVATVQFRDANCLGYCTGAEAIIVVAPTSGGATGTLNAPTGPISPPPTAVAPPPTVTARPLQ